MKFQVQQKVKVTKVFEEDAVDVGDILVVAGVTNYPDEQPYRCVPLKEWESTHPIDRRTDAGAWYSEDQLELHVPGYTVGTEVEITGNSNAHGFALGTTGEVISAPEMLVGGYWSQRVVQNKDIITQATWWIRISDMTPVVKAKEEVLELDTEKFLEGSMAKGEPGVLTKAPVTGGPSSYYNMPFSSWVTVNDMMEHLAEHKWGKYGIHLKDIFKGCCRWGEKSGTSVLYDTKKIIYFGLRILRMVGGNKLVQEYLHELSNDPQFKKESH